jgi:hypothetical protein
MELEIKTKDGYAGRSTIHYVSFGMAKVSEMFDIAHEVAKAADCKINDVTFENKGFYIQAWAQVDKPKSEWP